MEWRGPWPGPGDAVWEKPLTRSEKAFAAALAAMLKEMDFGDVRVTDILARSGFSRNAFYARYADKYDLASRMIEHELSHFVQHTVDYVRALEQGGDGSLPLAVQVDHYQHIYDHRDLYDAILDSRLPGLTLDEFCGRLSLLLKERIHPLPPAETRGVDAEMYGYVTIYASFACVKYWRLRGYQLTAEDIARQVEAFLRPGLPLMRCKPSPAV